MSNRKLNDILDRTKERVSFFAHAIPAMPETRQRDEAQRRRVIAVEIALIAEKFDRTKFSKPDPEMVAAWKKYM
ncbi:hypothetical protein ACFFSY_09115 [Paenibacillus aurantiacus]|uniref:Uncharacterized protein n=1 Tax=Paenibacillus aurantiacus TaxID=1936118 RepID=A0ABV5KNW6_9BACL